jgi:hypothetical protein
MDKVVQARRTDLHRPVGGDVLGREEPSAPVTLTVAEMGESAEATR